MNEVVSSTKTIVPSMVINIIHIFMLFTYYICTKTQHTMVVLNGFHFFVSCTHKDSLLSAQVSASFSSARLSLHYEKKQRLSSVQSPPPVASPASWHASLSSMRHSSPAAEQGPHLRCNIYIIYQGCHSYLTPVGYLEAICETAFLHSYH